MGYSGKQSIGKWPFGKTRRDHSEASSGNPTMLIALVNEVFFVGREQVESTRKRIILHRTGDPLNFSPEQGRGLELYPFVKQRVR